MLPIENLKIMPYWNPVGSTEIRASIRYWDRAGTEGGGNYSAGVLMHALNDGRYVISHIERGQWSAYVREKNIRRWAEDDARVYANYEVGIEQEPGSSGKDVAEATVRNLAGFSVFVDKVTGSKEMRANPFAAMVQNSGVLMIAGSWIQEFVREAEAFPKGKYDDQIDGCSGAFNRLAQRLKFELRRFVGSMDKQRIVPVKYWRECVSFWVFCDHCGHPVEVRGVGGDMSLPARGAHVAAALSRREIGQPRCFGYHASSFFIRDFGLGKIDHDPLGCRLLS